MQGGGIDRRQGFVRLVIPIADLASIFLFSFFLFAFIFSLSLRLGGDSFRSSPSFGSGSGCRVVDQGCLRGRWGRC